MKLYIKQKVFSLGDRYKIYDEAGNPIFLVESELISLTSKMHFYNMMQEELFLIKRKVTMFLAKYEIYQGDTLVAVIEQKLTLLRNRLNIHSAYGEFTLEGDVFAHNFDLLCDGTLCGTVRKKWLSWGDSYELEVYDGFEPPFFCSIVIAIDHCLHNERN